MQNVEYKAELQDPALAATICRSLGAVHAGTLLQTDTYFRVPDAKLKRREVPGSPTEYIFYNRPSRSRPKLSSYTIYTEQQAMERFGETPLPVWVVVKKRRELYLYKGVRIHLDEVDGLGNFLEFEAVVTPDCNFGHCHTLVEELRAALGPALGEPIACGYAELLAEDESRGK